MTFAVSNAVNIWSSTETVWNEGIVGGNIVARQQRFTGESLTYAKKTVVSETIRSDRMRDALNLVSFDTKGDLNYELAMFDLESFMEGAFFSSFSGIHPKVSTGIAFTSTQITAASGLAVYPAGSYIWVSGSSNVGNNIRYQVTASTSGTITTSPAPYAAVSAGDSVTISGDAYMWTATTSTLILTVTSGPSVITFSGSTGFDPTTLNLSVGQWVQLSGFVNAQNNGIKRIQSFNTTSITFVSGGMTSEVSTNTQQITIYGRMMRNGTTPKSFLIQKAFSDITQVIKMKGMMVSDMKLDLQSAAIIKGTYSFMGGQVVRASTGPNTGGYTGGLPLNTTPPMTSATSVGNITQAGSTFPAGIKAIQFALNNNLRTSEQLGSLNPLAIGYGFADITGSLEAYFQDGTLYDQLINNSSNELVIPLTDSVGNSYVITLPSVVFTDGFPMAGAGNQDIMFPLNWQAIRNSTYNCEVQIDQIATV